MEPIRKTIYLASTSPRRAELLRSVGILYTPIDPKVQERDSTGSKEDRAISRAMDKAWAVCARVEDGWVLGADTMVFHDYRLMNKPRDKQEAQKMLESLSKQVVEVYTGMCLMNAKTGKHFERAESALVTFDRMTPHEISQYIETGEPMDKAGAFAVQGRGGAFIRAIDGDYTAAVGLSLNGLRKLMYQAGLYDPDGKPDQPDKKKEK